MRAMAEQGRKSQARGPGRGRRRLSRRRAPGGKRGRGAAGKTPIVAAVETTAERRPRRLRLSVVKGFRKKEVERLAERDFAAGSNVVSDGLSSGRRSRRPAASTSRWRPVQEAGRELGAVQVGQYLPGQHQNRARRHLPPCQREACAVLPHQLRLSRSSAASSSTASSSALPGPPSIPPRSPGYVVSDA